jgi:hypothetical protein
MKIGRGVDIGAKNGGKKVMTKTVVSIDPGLTGAIVVKRKNEYQIHIMPTAEGRVCFNSVYKILKGFENAHVYIERAIPFAMGAKSAFFYGQDFRTLEIAAIVSKKPYTLIEPQKWTKVIHQGTNAQLKPKARSLIALKRLYPDWPELVPLSPKAKKPHEGVIDALLILKYVEMSHI